MEKGLSLTDKIRGKLSWHYQRDYIYRFSALKGWAKLKFYRMIYPNFIGTKTTWEKMIVEERN